MGVPRNLGLTMTALLITLGALTLLGGLLVLLDLILAFGNEDPLIEQRKAKWWNQ